MQFWVEKNEGVDRLGFLSWVLWFRMALRVPEGGQGSVLVQMTQLGQSGLRVPPSPTPYRGLLDH